ncbi:hypothetical protein FCV25MIE_04910 [Fagus crenata]
MDEIYWRGKDPQGAEATFRFKQQPKSNSQPPNGTAPPPPGRAPLPLIPFFASSNSLGANPLVQTVGIGHGKAWVTSRLLGWVTSRPLGSGTARLGGRLGRGVGLSFAAWPAGWVSPSRRGRGVGLLWAVVVAGLTGALAVQT